MKMSIGNTYEEAVTLKPVSRIRREELENCIRHWTKDSKIKVIINYKDVSKGCRYRWKFAGPFCYIIKDTANETLVMQEKNPAKPMFFKSIYKAMCWIYKHDKEYYDSLPNLALLKLEKTKENKEEQL